MGSKVKDRSRRKNKSGEIVAQLYIFPDGTLHEDSWICPAGWK